LQTLGSIRSGRRSVALYLCLTQIEIPQQPPITRVTHLRNCPVSGPATPLQNSAKTSSIAIKKTKNSIDCILRRLAATCSGVILSFIYGALLPALAVFDRNQGVPEVHFCRDSDRRRWTCLFPIRVILRTSASVERPRRQKAVTVRSPDWHVCKYDQKAGNPPLTKQSTNSRLLSFEMHQIQLDSMSITHWN